VIVRKHVKSPSVTRATVKLNRETEAFLGELARRLPPSLGIVISTRNGKLTVTPQEKRHLDAVATQTGRSPQELIECYI
jgi:hypothetical protein